MKHIATAPPAYRSRRRGRRSLAAYGFPYPPTARIITRQGTTRNAAFTYNDRSESPRRLVGGLDKPRSAFAPRGRAGNGVPASQLISDVVDDTDLNGWEYDNIGNRRMEQRMDGYEIYTANQLNQYTAIEEAEGTFTPTYDADGNQMRVKTSTGIWNVTYNAKNRPVLFTKDDNSVSVECTYDYMGRRATKKVTENGTVTLHQRYLYRGYLQIACCDLLRSNEPCLWLITWDPTQPIATRPLAIQKDGTWYTYGWDLTKNVWEVYGTTGYIGTAYTYTAYGQVTANGAVEQPIQWSSEVRDGELGLVYYNYRHYNPIDGRWIGMDFIEDEGNFNLQGYIANKPIVLMDILGLLSCSPLSAGGLSVFVYTILPPSRLLTDNAISWVKDNCKCLKEWGKEFNLTDAEMSAVAMAIAEEISDTNKNIIKRIWSWAQDSSVAEDSMLLLPWTRPDIGPGNINIYTAQNARQYVIQNYLDYYHAYDVMRNHEYLLPILVSDFGTALYACAEMRRLSDLARKKEVFPDGIFEHDLAQNFVDTWREGTGRFDRILENRQGDKRYVPQHKYKGDSRDYAKIHYDIISKILKECK